MARSCHSGISGASDGFAGSYRFAQFPQRRELTSCEPVNLVAVFTVENDTKKRERERKSEGGEAGAVGIPDSSGSKGKENNRARGILRLSPKSCNSCGASLSLCFSRFSSECRELKSFQRVRFFLNTCVANHPRHVYEIC